MSKSRIVHVRNSCLFDRIISRVGKKSRMIIGMTRTTIIIKIIKTTTAERTATVMKQVE